MKIAFIQHRLFSRIPVGLISCFTLFILLVLSSIRAEAQLFVDADATGNNDGSSWTDAYVNLQDALAASSHGEGIFVAEGIYYPDMGGGVTDNDRSATFQLIDGVEIYGGFDPDNGDDTFGERDWEANPTILSGDIDQNDTTTDGVVTNTDNINGDNSYHVVTSSGNTAATILDGFIITAGRAASTLSNGIGGGMYIYSNSTVTLENLIFVGNRADEGGGGINSVVSDPSLTTITFKNNSSGFHGGGMYNKDSNPILNKVIFSANSADTNGGGLYNNDSNPTLTDVIFVDNISLARGGGMNNIRVTTSLTNVIFLDNSADTGGGMYNDKTTANLTNVSFTGNTSTKTDNTGGGGMQNRDSSPGLINVIIWNNQAFTSANESIYNEDKLSTPAISHSIIANSGGSTNWNTDVGTDNGNNLDTNPFFVDASDPDGPDNEFFTDDDGLSLQVGSPAIDAGTNTPFGSGGDAEGVTTDLAGNNRIFDNETVDMGAYEFQDESSSVSPDGNNILYVDINVPGGDGSGNSWTNAIPELHDALMWANEEWNGSDPPLQIWVAEGIYKPITPADLGNVSTTEREATFNLLDNVEIYGGFNPGSGDDTFGERDWEANPTILSGDIDDNDTTTDGVVTDTDNISGDNSYHVVFSSGNSSATILDGFIITAGLANTGTLPNNVGGGMYIVANSSLTLENLKFIGNRAESRGGGMDNYTGDPTLTKVTFSNNSSGNSGGGMTNRNGASPVLNRVLFIDNNAYSEGGGMQNDDSSPKLTNVVFRNNYSDGVGGGIHNENGGNATIVNGFFSGNTAAQWGGGMHNDNSNPKLINVTFTGNTSNRSDASGGGGMHNRNNSSPTLTNVIMWENNAYAISSESIYNADSGFDAVITHSIIEGSGGSDNWDSDIGTDNGNNLDTNPLFVDVSDPDGPDNEFFTDDDGLALQSASIAINTGLNTPFESGGDAEGVTTDLAGNSRIYDGLANTDIVDMGAYEFQGERSGTSSVVINGVAGWRMMGVPVTDVTVEDLSEINLVQGIPGLPEEIGEDNLYHYNGAFVAPAGGSTVLQPGTGFIWYMWGPEANPALPESKTFPLTVELTGNEIAGDVSLGTLAADWHLIANPFIDDINFDEITDGDDSPLGVAGSVWDPNEGAEGSYVLTTSSALNNQLSAWQGAFIELSSSTEVIIPQSAKTSGAAFLKEGPLAGQIEFQLESFDNNGNVRSLDRAAILYFHQNASPKWDGYDVSKLIPLSESWATMNFIGNKNGESVLKSQHSLPYDFAGSDVIPVDIQVQNISGEFRLSWPVIQNLPLVDLILEDRETGKYYDLSQQGSISFIRKASAKEMSEPGVDLFLKLPEVKPMKAKTTEPRFAILINPDDSDYEEIPTEVALNQNYPNPFNPSTVISYQLPASSDVRLDVFDMVGRRISTLVNEQVQAGRHTVTFDGSGLSSGIYMYRLQANGSVITKKLTLLK